jgi:hypothetical protein
VRTALLAAACLALHASAPSFDARPRVMLWAWERPEDLRFLAGRGDTGVAFLAATVTLADGAAETALRRQPLRVHPDTRLTAVVRVESRRGARYEAERAAIVRELARAAALPGVREVQIDYDAARSERGFYAELLRDARRALPASTPLSMTALASWCMGDDWLDDAKLPVAEVVPMLFAMGPDAKGVLGALAARGDFEATACRRAIGLSRDDAPRAAPRGRRVYLWSARAWDASSFTRARERLQ